MSLNFLPRIEEIVRKAQYFDSSEAFISKFEPAWSSVRTRILKLETLDFYDEGDNQSLKAFLDGDIEKSKKLISQEKQGDAPIYQDLKKRWVEIIRCRPIAAPPNEYLKWEIENYKENIKLGERIFIANMIAVTEIFERYATKDFMVFDTRFGYIYDYDKNGRLLGGWYVEDVQELYQMSALFSFIQSNCVRFESVYSNGD